MKKRKFIIITILFTVSFAVGLEYLFKITTPEYKVKQILESFDENYGQTENLSDMEEKLAYFYNYPEEKNWPKPEYIIGSRINWGNTVIIPVYFNVLKEDETYMDESYSYSGIASYESYFADAFFYLTETSFRKWEVVRYEIQPYKKSK